MDQNDQAVDADDELDDDNIVLEGEENDDESDVEDPAPTLEEYKAQQKRITALEARLKRANKQAQTLREAKANGGNHDNEDHVAQHLAELKQWQTRSVRSAAKAMLLSRGADPDLVELPLGRLNFDEIEWDGDDPVLEDWADEMEEKYKKVFVKQIDDEDSSRPTRLRTQRIDQGVSRRQRKALSFGEQVVANAGLPRSSW